ncbi:MAG TPA: FAD:protein FMN transferase [Anaeromyxobacteraceae bacterium]|nr:FAD:protein FMN transferase [Anaeromyxobacteraceae bacterium]
MPLPLAVLLAASLPAASLGKAEEPDLYAETRPSMSTVVSITVAGARPAAAARAVDAAFAEFWRVEATMNEWRPGSPLSALNAAAGSGALTALPADLCQVLRLARAGADRTGGLFDPTWAALRDLWRFGEGEAGGLPSPGALAARCPLVSWRGLTLRGRPGAACQARLERAGMQVGLGGIAKGWAVDRAAAALRAAGLRDFLVQAGGDLYASGRRGDRPWRVGLRDPRGGPAEAFAWLDLRDQALSSSGDYEHFFVEGGVRYHHLIDPRTCRPATASRAASVLAGSPVEAEILSKATFVLGGEEALALAGRAGAEAVLVTAGNRVVVSPSLAARLEWRPPSP